MSPRNIQNSIVDYDLSTIISIVSELNFAKLSVFLPKHMIQPSYLSNPMPVKVNLSFKFVMGVQIPTITFWPVMDILNEDHSSITLSDKQVFQIPDEFKTTEPFWITISDPPSENVSFSFFVQWIKGLYGIKLMKRYFPIDDFVFKVLKWENCDSDIF